MSDTIFSKILDGTIPCHKIYEDTLVLAFLDINPLSKGHTLIIPKEPAVTIDELSDESSAAIGRVLPRIARAVMAATATEHYNVLQNNGASANQAVLHVHFHIIPKESSGAGLGIGWKPGPFDHDEGTQLAAAMAELVSNTNSQRPA